MKKISLLSLLAFLLISACGGAQKNEKLVGYWIQEDRFGNADYEFFADGNGLLFVDHEVKDLSYKLIDDQIEIIITDNNRVLSPFYYQISFVSENEFLLWSMDDDGNPYNERRYKKTTMAFLPVEEKKFVFEELGKYINITEAQKTSDDPIGWMLTIDIFNTINDYELKQISGNNWQLEKIPNLADHITSTAISRKATDEANFDATSSVLRMQLTAAAPTPIPTLPNQDFSGFISKAGILCKNSYINTVDKINSAFAPFPGIVVKDTDPLPGMSLVIDDFLQQASSTSEVKTLVCILTEREKSVEYTNGSIGYKLVQTVNILSWPDGKLYFSNTISGRGTAPFGVTTNPGAPIYGDEPLLEVMDWVVSKIN